MRVEVELFQEEGLYRATAVAYPSVAVTGRTEKEALGLLVDALEKHLKEESRTAAPRAGPTPCGPRSTAASPTRRSRGSRESHERGGGPAELLPLCDVVAVDHHRPLPISELAELPQRPRHRRRVPENGGQHVAVHVLPRVAGIRGEDEVRVLAGAHPHRLVAGSVPVGRHEHEPAVAEDVVLAAHELVVERMVKIDRARTISDRRAHLHLSRRLHLRALDEERGMGKELVPAAMVEVKVRVDDVADVVGDQTEQRELAHHFVGGGRPEAEAPGAPLAQAADGIGERLAMDTGVHEDMAARVGDQKADHRHGGPRSGRHVAEEAAQIQIDETAAQRIDVHHGSPHLRSRGSSASRTASPTKFNPTTVTNKAAPGQKTIQGACWR